MQFKDRAGNPLTYIQFTGLLSNGSSETVEFMVDPTPTAGMLSATLDDDVAVMCRVKDTGLFVNISTDPIDLSVINEGPDTVFELYLATGASIQGLYRVPLTIVAGSSLPAGWVEA